MGGDESTHLTRRLVKVAVAVAVATAVLAGALLGSPLGPALVMPGPTSSAHASVAEDCGACHAASMASVKGPLHGVTGAQIGAEESARCLDCHMLGENALTPHGLPPADLGALREAARGGTGAAPVADGQPSSPDGEFTCATCHHEHRGREANLTALDRSRCQSCHLESFGSIADGHPEFGRYPYTRPAPVHFDHAKHVSRYFEEAEDDLAPSLCSDCHTLGPDGASMRTTGFDDMCGSCHAAEIGGHGQVDATGIAFLGLPAVDTLSLEDAGVNIGRWPADTDVADGVLTPFAALLLSSEPRAAADLEAVAGLDWMDLSAASPAETAAIGRLIWDLKQLLAEVAGGGHGDPS